jgi:acyl-CoA synthetase (AMP-forming)/AMP-acid ligase II
MLPAPEFALERAARFGDKPALVDRYDLSSLRLVGCGAAPLGAEVEQRCADRLGCQVVQGLGLTEGTCAVAIGPPDAPRRGSAGRLLDGTEARIVDPDGGGDLGPGRTGELWLRGPQVMRGYRNQPEATARAVDPDGWLRTGDLCYLGADELRAWVAERAAPYKRLRDVRFVDQVPRSPTGKLLRRALVEAERAEAGRAPVAVR